MVSGFLLEALNPLRKHILDRLTTEVSKLKTIFHLPALAVCARDDSIDTNFAAQVHEVGFAELRDHAKRANAL